MTWSPRLHYCARGLLPFIASCSSLLGLQGAWHQPPQQFQCFRDTCGCNCDYFGFVFAKPKVVEIVMMRICVEQRLVPGSLQEGCCTCPLVVASPCASAQQHNPGDHITAFLPSLQALKAAQTLPKLRRHVCNSAGCIFILPVLESTGLGSNCLKLQFQPQITLG